MSVGQHSGEKIATTIQHQCVRDKPEGCVEISQDDTPPLASSAARDRNRLWRGFWHRTEKHDLDAVATQPSVFDDPVTLELYRPPPSYENTHRFDSNARWTFREEQVRCKWCGHLSPFSQHFVLASCAEDRLEDHVVGFCHVFRSRPRP
jgi:hypothetical protein